MARGTTPSQESAPPLMQTPTAADRLAEARATKAATRLAREAATVRVRQLRATLAGVDGQREITVQGREHGTLVGPITAHPILVADPIDQSPEAHALAQLDLPDALRAELLAIVADQRADAAMREAVAADLAARLARLIPQAREAQLRFFAAVDGLIAGPYADFLRVLDRVDADLGNSSLTAELRWPEFDTSDAGSLVNFRKRFFGIM